MTDNRRSRILYIYKMLLEETDDQHPLTIPQIVSKLHSLGIEAERRTVYEDIEALRTFGLDIIYQKEKNHNYYIGARSFELAELKLLADAVQSSRFITPKKSEQLIKKLQSLTSQEQAKELSRQIYITNRVKSPNEQIFYNVDALHKAIDAGKQITFQYMEYGFDKKLHPRRDGELYHASPYLLSWDDENYYLIAWHDRYESLSHFRVDKMANIAITTDDCRPLTHPLDAAEYARRTFGMFPGEPVKVEIWFDAGLIGVVIDRFGADVFISSSDEIGFTVSIDATISPAFLAWLIQFGDKAKILSPESIKDDLMKLLDKIMCLYKK